jgi:predicted  nucleic acid-binding Zn-ribbon protein
VEWNKKLAEIEALNEELAAARSETASLKAEMEGHKGTITTLTDETKKLRTQVQQHLTALTRKSQLEMNKFNSAFQTFLHEIEQHVHDLQIENDQ